MTPPCRVIGCLGEDAFGRQLSTFLSSQGIDLTYVRYSTESHTGTAVITVVESDNGIVVIPGANALVNEADVAQPADEVAEVLTDLAAGHNIAVDVPHHVSKGKADPGNPDRGRGASAAKDAARLVYSLSTMTSDEAGAFGVPQDERRFFIRLDSAKVNLAPPQKAKWFKLVGVRLNNVTELYPSGDEVQTVETWSPPGTWEGLDNWTLNSILDTIAYGMQDGERYSDDNAAKTRAAWKVIQERAPIAKTEDQCKEIIHTWVQNGVLVRELYESKKDRKERMGLEVNNAKRPGTEL